MAFFQIAFCVLMPDEELEDYSPLQGFPRGLITRHWVFNSLLKVFPPTILELYKPSVNALQQRLAGKAPYLAIPLFTSALPAITITTDQPFLVAFADQETSDAVEEWRQRLQMPPLVIRCDRDFLGDDPRAALRERLFQHCENIFEEFHDSLPEDVREHIPAIRRGSPKDATIDFGLPYWDHNTTAPNEIAMLSAGCRLGPREERLFGEDDVYVRAIIESADRLDRLRSTIPPTNLYRAGRPPCTLVLTVPSMYRHVVKAKKPKGLKERLAWEMLRALQKQTTYRVEIDTESPQSFLKNPQAQSVIYQRTGELHALTSGLALRSASQLCPVLRLPPSLNHVDGEIIQLSDTLCQSRPNVLKLAKTASRLFNKLSELVDQRFLDHIDGNHTHVKIVANTPLEWLPVRKLPLALRHCVSRIPVTPGALTFVQLIPRLEIYPTLDAFSEVLVIRSFKKNDPLRRHLANAVEAFRLDGDLPMPVRFVDVANRAELVQALNDYHGAMVIFDCHGVHHVRDDVARLVLADELVNVWELHGKVTMPPIVFACACETHAANRSHITVANGLLHCGASSVIASAMPIRSDVASIFVARMLFQIFKLLPGIVDGPTPRSIRWDEAFGYLQRMMFVSEFMRKVVPANAIDSSTMMQLQAECTFLIHRRGPEWYEESLALIASMLKMPIEELRERQEREMPFPEVLKYLHIGNPETVVISTAEPRIDWYVDGEIDKPSSGHGEAIERD